MTRLEVKKNKNEEYLIFKGKSPLKTKMGNQISTYNLKSAKKIICEIKKNNLEKENNFFNFLFYSNDIDNKQRIIIEKNITKFTDTDLVFYRANSGSELESIQKKFWDPFIKYYEESFNIKLKVCNSIMPIKQIDSYYKKIKKILKSLNKYDITVLFFLVELTNSIVISFIVLNKNMSIDQIWKAISIEEKYNEKKWGIDQEANQKLLLKKKFFTDIINFKNIFK